ncbi:pirin family protein [Phytoactinopolyspora mesophila]|uniref:Pirin family protein n=1 Tax=Phytoactinopolyspora mesophila TaxID=2650750 RepID=A0A7K3M128_9ACTN|nr:pirin-like bicupin family protein [Phytoactinopolyspora mesophila]NDL56979.1 pirin family protein [Phytoactinopolyspora mesophila]
MRGIDRFVSSEPGLVSRHSFSFGRHYDPANVGFGMLVMNNDDVVQPGAGYATHPHRDVEIVTWVLEGALAHRDSTGAGGVIHPGLAQRLGAGRGVVHSEFNDAPSSSVAGEASSSGDRTPTAPLRFVQMWVPPDEPGMEPRYEQRDLRAELSGGRLVVVASGMPRHAGEAAIGLGQSSAAMHVAQLGDSCTDLGVTLPAAPFVHVYVARGVVQVEGVGQLGEGDAARMTDEGGRRVRAVTAAEIIVWEMHAHVGR